MAAKSSAARGRSNGVCSLLLGLILTAARELAAKASVIGLIFGGKSRYQSSPLTRIGQPHAGSTPIAALNPSLPYLVNRYERHDPSEERGTGGTVRGDTLQRGIQSADHRQHDRISQPERSDDETGKPLNPVVAWRSRQ